MKQTCLIILILSCGCSGSKTWYRSASSPAPAEADSYDYAEEAMAEEAEMAQEAPLDRSRSIEEIAVMESSAKRDYTDVPTAREAPVGTKAGKISLTKRSAADRLVKQKIKAKPPVKSPASKQPESQLKQPKAAVVYTGYLKLRVKRLLEATDEITRITEEKKGYIESLTEKVIVVRIPAHNFDQVMSVLAAVGQLLDRRIQAYDVTEQFTDLHTRLKVAQNARQRLLDLLKKVRDVEERLRILEEITRLSEQIGAIESTLATLQNLLDYFTITIELVPVLEHPGEIQHRSPFQWIRALTPHVATIAEDGDDVTLALPTDFVHFDEADDIFLARAADTTTIRIGRVDNEPLGDNKYWIEAIHFEMHGRGEEQTDQGDNGKVWYRTYKSQDLKPRFYLVGIHVKGDDIYVVEVFYPNQVAFEKHHSHVVRALTTLEVN